MASELYVFIGCGEGHNASGVASLSLPSSFVSHDQSWSYKSSIDMVLPQLLLLLLWTMGRAEIDRHTVGLLIFP